MIEFQRNGLRLVFFTLVISNCLQYVTSKDIIVSKNIKSNDTSNCGLVIQPCKTIEYAVHIANPFDTILIDGGHDGKQYQYHLNETLNINKELSITSYRSKDTALIFFNPLPRTPYKKETFCNVRSRLNITSLDFIINISSRDLNLSLFRSENISGAILIVNSSFHINSFELEDLIIFNLYCFTIDTEYWDVKFIECNFNVNAYSERNTITLAKGIYKRQKKDNNFGASFFAVATFDTCSFRGLYGFNGAQIASGFGVLNITRTKFISSNININSDFNTVVSYSNFTSSAVIFDGFGSLILRNLQFNGSLDDHSPQLYLFVKKVIIQDSLFHNASAGVLTVDTAEDLLINNSIFKNNKRSSLPSDKSNLELESTHIRISGCNFENNTIPMWKPGTIRCMEMCFITLQNTTVNGGVLPNINDNPVVELGSYTFKENVTFSCPLNYYYRKYSPPEYYKYTFICVKCDRTKYSIKTEAKVVWNETKGDFDDYNITCLDCPYEAICEGDGIRSKGNYWGFISETGNVEFVHCPTSYCCSSPSTCRSYNTCMDNRKGRLCTECKDNYSISLFGNYKCIKDGICETTYFWIAFVTLAIFYLLIFLYLKEVTLFFKRCCSSISNQGQRRNQTLENEDVEEYFDDEHVDQASPFQLIPYQVMETQDYQQESTLVAGTIKILFFFYQAASIIRVDTSTKANYNIPPIIDILTSFFNVRIDIRTSNIHLCPFKDGTVVEVELIKSGFLLLCPLLLLIATFFQHCSSENKLCCVKQNNPSNITKRYKVIDHHSPSYSKLPCSVRAKCTYVQLLLIGFSSTAVFSFQLLNCVEILDEKYLFIQASTKCYTLWQTFVIICIALWVIPFCFSLYFSCNLLRSCRITPNQFLLVNTFPPTIIWYIVKSNLDRVDGFLNQDDAMAARHLLLVVDEPFRYNITEKHIRVQWEPILIFRRLVLVVLRIFLISPIKKLYSIGIMLASYLIHHMFKQPYKDMRLNYAETVSLTTLCFLNLLNIFWAFTDELDIKKSVLLNKTGNVFLYLELTILLVPFLIAFCYVLLNICTHYGYKIFPFLRVPAERP